MSEYWFAKKRIGWGVRPASWQGWAVLIICIAVGLGAYSYFWTAGETLIFAAILTADVLVFGVLSWVKFDRGSS